SSTASRNTPTRRASRRWPPPRRPRASSSAAREATGRSDRPRAGARGGLEESGTDTSLRAGEAVEPEAAVLLDEERSGGRKLLPGDGIEQHRVGGRDQNAAAVVDCVGEVVAERAVLAGGDAGRCRLADLSRF